MSFSRGTMVKNLPANAGDIRDSSSIPGSGGSLGGGNGNSFQYYCLKNPVDRGALWSTVHSVPESQTRLKLLCTHNNCIWASLVAQTEKNLPAMQETWVQSLGWEDSLEEEVATRSSILAWRIPWTAEPGGLQSMGSQRSQIRQNN